MSTAAFSEVSSPLEVDLWQLDKITDLFENGYSIEEIADQVRLDPMLVREVIETRNRLLHLSAKGMR